MEESHRKIAKDEINTIEYPICLPCHRHPKGRSTIHIREQGTDPQGNPTSQHWIVEGLKGLPLAIDEEVLLGLTHLLHKQGFKDRHVYFTQYSFLTLLGWSRGLYEYKRLKQSLDRLSGVRIESKGTFWDHQNKCRVTRKFHLIEDYTLYERDGNPGEQPFVSRVTFSEFIFRSFQAGFIKTLDFDFYLSLKLPIARKLFRYLDKQAHQGEVFDIDLMRLAEKLAITGSAYPSKVKEHLDTSHNELLERGFLAQAVYIRRGRTPSVRYRMAPRDNWAQAPQRLIVPTPRVQEHPLLLELVARGITRIVARRLLDAHGEKVVADKLEIFDHLRAEQSPMVTKNPAGFLRSSIEKNFEPPAGYVSRAERQRQKQEAEEAHRRERELKETAEQAHAHRKAQFDALWTSLSEDDQVCVETDALARLNPFARKCYIKEKAEGRVGSGHHALRHEIETMLVQRLVPTGNSTIETTVS
jgi:hypothetical protein